MFAPLSFFFFSLLDFGVLVFCFSVLITVVAEGRRRGVVVRYGKARQSGEKMGSSFVFIPILQNGE